MPIRVAIVEDDDEIRASLSELIGANSTFRCVHSYADAESALAARGAAAADPRETDVLNQLAQGFRYKEIVDNLGISAPGRCTATSATSMRSCTFIPAPKQW